MSEKNLEVMKSQHGILLKGIYPPIPTPFDGKGRIALDALKNNLAALNQFELRGYVVLGSNGEFVMMTMEERLLVMEAARALIPPNKLMIAGTGCQSTEETVFMTQKAGEIGADAALVISPSYYRSQMTPEALINHFHAVADNSPIPILLYNMPACTGIDLELELIGVLSRHPNIIGLKDSSGDMVKIGTLRHELGPAFQVLAGSGSFLLPALSVGAVGGVLALANIAPGQCLAILRYYTEGRMKEAQNLQVRMIPLNTAVTSRFSVPGLKAAMDSLGMYGGPVRSPLIALSGDNKKIVEAIITKAGLKN